MAKFFRISLQTIATRTKAWKGKLPFIEKRWQGGKVGKPLCNYILGYGFKVWFQHKVDNLVVSCQCVKFGTVSRSTSIVFVVKYYFMQRQF